MGKSCQLIRCTCGRFALACSLCGSQRIGFCRFDRPHKVLHSSFPWNIRHNVTAYRLARSGFVADTDIRGMLHGRLLWTLRVPWNASDNPARLHDNGRRHCCVELWDWVRHRRAVGSPDRQARHAQVSAVRLRSPAMRIRLAGRLRDIGAWNPRSLPLLGSCKSSRPQHTRRPIDRAFARPPRHATRALQRSDLCCDVCWHSSLQGSVRNPRFRRLRNHIHALYCTCSIGCNRQNTLGWETSRSPRGRK